MKRYNTADDSGVYEHPSGDLVWYDDAQKALTAQAETIRVLREQVKILDAGLKHIRYRQSCEEDELPTCECPNCLAERAIKAALAAAAKGGE